CAALCGGAAAGSAEGDRGAAAGDSVVVYRGLRVPPHKVVMEGVPGSWERESARVIWVSERQEVAQLFAGKSGPHPITTILEMSVPRSIYRPATRPHERHRRNGTIDRAKMPSMEPYIERIGLYHRRSGQVRWFSIDRARRLGLFDARTDLHALFETAPRASRGLAASRATTRDGRRAPRRTRGAATSRGSRAAARRQGARARR